MVGVKCAELQSFFAGTECCTSDGGKMDAGNAVSCNGSSKDGSLEEGVCGSTCAKAHSGYAYDKTWCFTTHKDAKQRNLLQDRSWCYCARSGVLVFSLCVHA